MRGVVFVLVSELCFALSSFFTKGAWTDGQVPGAETTAFRFFLGFLVAAAVLVQRGTGFRPVRFDLVLWRGGLNSTALVLFALSLQGTLLSKANTLNMTYPVFVFLIAPFVTGVKAKPLAWVLVTSALAGIVLVIRPDWSAGINVYDLLGLASGIVAAFGVTSLDLARKYDGTFMILFWMMGVGTLVSLVAWAVQAPWVGGVVPSGLGLVAFLAAGMTGVLGQVFITAGYGFVDARTGSVLSSSRILYSTVLGLSFLGERLDAWAWAGIALVTAAIALTGWARRPTKEAA